MSSSRQPPPPPQQVGTPTSETVQQMDRMTEVLVLKVRKIYTDSPRQIRTEHGRDVGFGYFLSSSPQSPDPRRRARRGAPLRRRAPPHASGALFVRNGATAICSDKRQATEELATSQRAGRSTVEVVPRRTRPTRLRWARCSGRHLRHCDEPELEPSPTAAKPLPSTCSIASGHCLGPSSTSMPTGMRCCWVERPRAAMATAARAGSTRLWA